MAQVTAPWFGLATVAAIVLGRSGAPALVAALVPPVMRNPKASVLVLAAASLVVLLLFAGVVLDGFPNSGDEYACALQAETYAQGRLWVSPPANDAAFEMMHFLAREGKWLSIYQPGWALLLALPAILHLPLWLVNPLLGALFVVAFFRLARLHVQVEAAWLAALGVCTSAFFLLNFASLFSHGAGALGAVLFALCGVRYLERGQARWALLAGLCLGAIGFIRAVNAVLLVPPFLVALAMTPKRRVGLLWLALGGVPFALALLAYNKAITGNPLVLVQAWVWKNSEPIGAPSGQALGETVKRLARLYLWTSPAFFFGWPLAFLAVAWRKRLSFVDWLAPLTVLGFVSYGGDGGNQYGPRYYFEAWPLAFITVAKAIEPIFSGAQKRAEWIAAAIAAHVSFQLGYLLPRAHREHQVVMERQEPYQLVAKAGLKNAVVLIIDDAGKTRPMPARDLDRNGLVVGDEPVTYAVEKGDEVTRLLVQDFPGRQFYRYYGGALHEALDAQGRLIPNPRPLPGSQYHRSRGRRAP